MKYIFLLLVTSTMLSACTEHPYETDGHNDVHVPDVFRDQEDSLTERTSESNDLKSFKKEQVALENEIENAFADVCQAILSDRREAVASHVDFPLGPESAYGFTESSSKIDSLTIEGFLDGYEHFFTPAFLDSLQNGTWALDSTTENGIARLSLRVNTIEGPKNDFPAVERNHRISFVMKDAEIRITGFGRLQ